MTYVVHPVGGKYVVVDSDSLKIVSKHLTYAVAERHCEKLIEQARKHTQPGEPS